MKPTPAAFSGDAANLTYEENQILQNQVLPTARRWVEQFPPGDYMHEHGQKTLDFWKTK